MSFYSCIAKDNFIIAYNYISIWIPIRIGSKAVYLDTIDDISKLINEKRRDTTTTETICVHLYNDKLTELQKKQYVGNVAKDYNQGGRIAYPKNC